MSEQHSIPHQLRRAREAQGRSLEDVRRRTGLSERVLSGLEAGQYDVLEPIFARMAVRAYAEHLGLDAEAIVRQYDQERPLVATAPPTPLVPPPVVAASSRRTLQIGAGIVVAFALVIVAYSLLSKQGDAGRPHSVVPAPTPPRAQPPQPIPATPMARTPEAPLDTVARAAADSARPDTGAYSRVWSDDDLPPEAQPSHDTLASAGRGTVRVVELSPRAPGDTALARSQPQPAAAPFQPPPVRSDSLLQLSVEAVDSTWVRVTWGGNGRYEGILPPGARRTWQTRDQFEVVAGKAHGLRYWFQGQLLGNGHLGASNQVLRFRASRSGVDLISTEPPPQGTAAPSGAPP